MYPKTNISQASYKGDQLCALLAIMHNSSAMEEDEIRSLIGLAWGLSVEILAIPIELEKHQRQSDEN